MMAALKGHLNQYNFLYSVQSQSFSSVFGMFGRKKKPEEKESERRDTKHEETVVDEPGKSSIEPTKYHKATVEVQQTQGMPGEDIKERIKTLDRKGQNNLYGRY